MSELVIVGGGPAGITAALEAVRLGVQVTMVTAEKPGGRATWHSLLPSKVFLHAAEMVANSQNFSAVGLQPTDHPPDLQTIRKRVAEVIGNWHQQTWQQLQDQHVQIIFGRASLQVDHQLEVVNEAGASQWVAYDKLILATGSVPVFFPQLEPDGQAILAPRLVLKLSRWPEHIVIVGAGATGSEYAYLFAQMGCQVTWITDLPEIMPRFDKDISARLEIAMTSLGVKLMKNTRVTGVVPDMGGVVLTLQGGRALAASHALIAIGRRADVEGLNLEAAGVTYDPAGIHINEFAQTSNADIYAIGDVAGIPYTVNKGQLQGYVAARHLAACPVEPVQENLLVEAVYTRPSLAQVGLNSKTAVEHDAAVESVVFENQNILNAHITGESTSAIKVLFNAGSGEILGGSAVGSEAAEKMALLATAMSGGLNIDQLAGLFYAHPTGGEILPAAARIARDR